MQIHATAHEPTTGLDISSVAFWSKTFDERNETFAQLRADHPVSWHPPMEDLDLAPEEHGEAGYWAVVRAEDIAHVSMHHELFSSQLGTTSLHPIPGNAGASFLDYDPPKHTAYRKIMSAAFTPKAVARLSQKIEERAAGIIDRVVGAGEIDFVDEVSSRLPMMTVADLLGVPEELMETFRQAGDDLFALQDPGVGGSREERFATSATAFGTLSQIATELAEARRAKPQDDIMTALVQANIDGEVLDEMDLTMITLLFATAGNDTTKQTTTWSLMQLEANPDQKRWLMDDYDGRIVGAIEEFVRHASPVMQFARTATQDVELGGQLISAGDKVGIFYCSGNRDESVFDRPGRFDLSRTPNRHQAFGGGGVHYCLGNAVAKAQLRALFRQILTKLPDIEIGEPVQLVSDFINGVRHLPVTIR
ncbi:cytochrome P450 [Microbacterium thalassium]|uniref:Cytochrome P450 n=1 Tax=Microbacterium thalassium TaxID=362649 RepID=A0A7X0FP21_9MICO|nr:cytochrome P450 [Microbacterium thalassium]MBB6390502.1 cytochrome P450 [Microbacterium thalassium]GLK25613.1 cytochrome P450 [Microbacterium thalassium]